MVGHIHEDVDQFFSWPLSQHNTQTLLELNREIGIGYSAASKATLPTFMCDIKQWLQEHAVPNLSAHIYHNHFKIVRCPGINVLFYYKKWSISTTCSPESVIQLLQRKEQEH